MSDVETLSVIEGSPAEWPAVPGVTGDLLAVCWQRIEHFIARRFVSRPVVFMVRSACGGAWRAPIGPNVANDPVASIWDDATGDWEPATLKRAPRGWIVPPGHVQIEMNIGSSPVPVPVSEAVKRLAPISMPKP